MENSEPTIARRYTPKERQQLVDLYRRSQMTQAQFTREHGLKLSTFQQWLYRPSKAAKPAKVKPPGFEELILGASATVAGWAAEVSFPTGMTVRLGHSTTPEMIEHLLKTMRQLC